MRMELGTQNAVFLIFSPLNNESAIHFLVCLFNNMQHFGLNGAMQLLPDILILSLVKI